MIQESNPENFYPLSLSTPVPALIIGGLRYYEAVALWLINHGVEPEIYVVTRKHLAQRWGAINKSLLMDLGLKFNLRFVEAMDEVPHGNSLLISTSLPPSIDLLSKLVGTLGMGGAITCNGSLLLGITRNGEISEVMRQCPDNVINGVWDIIRLNTELLITNETNLMRVLGSRVVNSEVDHRAVINESRGPVIIINSVIDALTYIRGPALIGPGVRILPHAYIREGSVFYMNNAVGGEVKNSVMDHDSLKEHLGYLGDSYVGRWVNLGAGSVTSNLKNTIGPIRYNNHETDMIKLGSVIGDWVKVGINTSIMSGRFIGQGSSVLGLIRRDVPPFSICINDDCSPFLLGKAIEVYRRFARLMGKEPSGYEEGLIEEVYAISRGGPNPP